MSDEEKETKSEAVTPFDFIKSISQTKKNVMDDPKEYKAYIVNKGLSYFPDTVFYANEMNIYRNIPPEKQYEFLLASVRPRNRYSKWHKKDKKEEKTINNIMEYYKCNAKIAKLYFKAMSNEDIEYINNIMATRQ